MLSKRLKCYGTGKIFSYAIYNFGNYDINIEGVKLSLEKQFFTMLQSYNRDNTICWCDVLLILSIRTYLYYTKFNYII